MTPVSHPRRGQLSGPLTALTCGIVAIVGITTWLLVSQKAPSPPTTREPGQAIRKVAHERFVGSKSCQECHAEVYTSYQHHPMASSTTLPGETTIIEDYTQATSFMSGGRRYRVTTVGDHAQTITNDSAAPGRQWQHHEKMVDAEGKDIYDQSVPIHFVIGSGSRGRSYVTQEQGRLYQSPITWYVQDQTWDLSPGYVPSGHQRFERLLGESCLSCHVGMINFAEDQTDQYDPETPFQELSIGCERCHGPGGRHVNAHRQGTVTTDQYIVNPEKLSSHERDSICYQCHLSGTHRVLRHNKHARDFRPGQPLRDVWTVFVEGTGVNQQQQARLTSNVEQMHASRCFQESNGQMGCISCHDAHYHPKPRERAAYYRARCLKCHDQQGCSLPASEQAAAPALNSCTFCHMQKLTTSDIAHSAQADHRILRFPQEPQSKTPQPVSSMKPQGKVTWHPFDGALDSLPEWDLNRATAIGRFHEAVKNQDIPAMQKCRDMLIQVVQQVPEDYLARFELAQIHYELKDYRAALEQAKRVLAINPTHQETLALAGFAAQLSNQFQDAIVFFQRKLTLNPRDSNLYLALAEMVGQQQDLRKAIEILKQGIEVDPSSILLHRVIADWYKRTNQPEQSQHHLDLIESIRFSMERDQAPQKSPAP